MVTFYGIVKEKTGYVVKVGINEVNQNLIITNLCRTVNIIKSFSQAMKKVNLIAGELNRIHEHTQGC